MYASFLAILNSFVSVTCFFLIACQSKPTDSVAREQKVAIADSIRPERDSVDTAARIYLTFDDGPYTTTPGLMQLLSKKGIRISFFVIGSQINKSPWHDSVFRAVEAVPNFKVYNHTHSHAVTNGRIHGYYRNPDGVWQDIVKNKSNLPEGVAITRLPGKNTWRTPNRTTRSDKQSGPLLRLLDTLKQPEFIVGWDVEWNQGTSENQADLDMLISQVEEKLAKAPSTKRDVVVLSHDYLYRTPRSLELLSAFIDHFQQKGNVKFDWVQHLPGLESGAAHSTAKR
ncbi:MAG: polysaccharide deacetylase family protein [Bacteroidota bacterium]